MKIDHKNEVMDPSGFVLLAGTSPAGQVTVAAHGGSDIAEYEYG